MSIQRPQKKHNHWRRREGNYNWLEPKEKQVCYEFILRTDAPKDLERSYLISPDKDSEYLSSKGSALDIAIELKGAIDSYWLNTDKNRIATLVDYLDSTYDDDCRDELLYNIADAEYKMSILEENLSDLKQEYIDTYNENPWLLDTCDEPTKEELEQYKLWQKGQREKFPWFYRAADRLMKQDKN